MEKEVGDHSRHQRQYGGREDGFLAKCASPDADLILGPSMYASGPATSQLSSLGICLSPVLWVGDTSPPTDQLSW